MNNVQVLDKERKVDPEASYTTCTDLDAVIVTVSDSFAALSGYSKEELLGHNHNIVRHPDMPKIIFKIMWEKLQNNKKFVGLVKNLAKDGSYYWLLNEVSAMAKKGTEGKVFYSYKHATTKRAIFHVGNLYKSLHEYEMSGGIKASQKYLDDFLAFRGVTFDEYMETMISTKGLLKGSYYITRKIFS